MQGFIYLFATFIFFSFLGWIMEVIISLIKYRKFVDRGFLLGPYCPIYGIGCICFIYIIGAFESNLFILFIINTIVGSIIEYSTSFILEKWFNARWWDYSRLPLNINGRICIPFSFGFGFGGMLAQLINPYIQNLWHSIPGSIFNPILIALIIWFFIDCIISFKIVNKLKLTSMEIYKDSTEEISEKIRATLVDKSKQFRRILQAFPTAYTTINKGKKKDK